MQAKTADKTPALPEGRFHATKNLFSDIGSPRFGFVSYSPTNEHERTASAIVRTWLNVSVGRRRVAARLQPAQ